MVNDDQSIYEYTMTGLWMWGASQTLNMYLFRRQKPPGSWISAEISVLYAFYSPVKKCRVWKPMFARYQNEERSTYNMILVHSGIVWHTWPLGPSHPNPFFAALALNLETAKQTLRFIGSEVTPILRPFDKQWSQTQKYTPCFHVSRACYDIPSGND